ncbi:MAG: hypothetical protein NDI91_10705 [Sulfuritalea sp.]|nr:hypothetical protein [Sulfuritalea sp.]
MKQRQAGSTAGRSLVAAAGNCAQGKWIYEDGKAQFGHPPEFEHLRAVRADFHLCAGSILANAHGGDREAATASLKSALRRRSPPRKAGSARQGQIRA